MIDESSTSVGHWFSLTSFKPLFHGQYYFSSHFWWESAVLDGVLFNTLLVVSGQLVTVRTMCLCVFFSTAAWLVPCLPLVSTFLAGCWQKNYRGSPSARHPRGFLFKFYHTFVGVELCVGTDAFSVLLFHFLSGWIHGLYVSHLQGPTDVKRKAGGAIERQADRKSVV